jgi:dihydroorotase
MMFDLLIKGGEVLDRPAGLSGRLDVAIARGAIAAVEPDIPEQSALRTIDATGRLVTPGLVDYHAHVFRDLTFWGVDADAYASRTGVTTWVDAGSPGAYTLPGFREFVVERSAVRILTFVNIAAIGLVGHNYELAEPAFSDPGLCARIARQHSDIVAGVKARMGTPTVGDTGVNGVECAKQAAAELDIPVMVHIGTGPPAIEHVVELLGNGDVLTHCYTGQDMKIVDDDGALLPAVARALERGMRLDLGHGSGSFAFRVAEPLIAAGILPHVLSTDMHQMSVYGPMFDLPTTLSKFLALGLELDDVIERATAAPARLLGLEGRIGTLRRGAAADVALFDVKAGSFAFSDIDRAVRTGDRLLVNALTIAGGRVLTRQPEPPAAPWMEHDYSLERNFYVNHDLRDELIARGETPAQMAAAADAKEVPA